MRSITIVHHPVKMLGEIVFDPSDSASAATGAILPRVPVLSVVIPHYNDLENLRLCLALLANQSVSSEDFEIIVADNNSTCGLSAVQEACQGVACVVTAPLQGAGPARNVGVGSARGNYLAFLDSDCRPCREWIGSGIKALALSEMVGGYVEVVAADPENPTPTESYEMIFAFNNRRYVESKGFSITANMFVRRDVFDAVGGFRPHVSEDLDWGRRAVALGFRWRYAPEVKIRHPARGDWPELTRKLCRVVRESFALVAATRAGVLW